MGILKCSEGEAQNREREIEGLGELQPKSLKLLKFGHAFTSQISQLMPLEVNRVRLDRKAKLKK